MKVSLINGTEMLSLEYDDGHDSLIGENFEIEYMEGSGALGFWVDCTANLGKRSGSSQHDAERFTRKRHEALKRVRIIDPQLVSHFKRYLAVMGAPRSRVLAVKLHLKFDRDYGYRVGFPSIESANTLLFTVE